MEKCRGGKQSVHIFIPTFACNFGERSICLAISSSVGKERKQRLHQRASSYPPRLFALIDVGHLNGSSNSAITFEFRASISKTLLRALLAGESLRWFGPLPLI